MGVWKLIEQLRSEIRGPGGLLEDAATALSTLQAENERLRDVVLCQDLVQVKMRN